MNREVIIARLKSRQARLQAFCIISASLFGSVARGDNTEASDIGIAVRLDPTRTPRGFAYVAFLDDLEAELSAVLERRVDVIPEPARKPRIQRRIDQERSLAF
jgi:predicted nucleotidyltransferase